MESIFFDSHGVDDPLVIELFQKEDSAVFLRLLYALVLRTGRLLLAMRYSREVTKLISIFIFISIFYGSFIVIPYLCHCLGIGNALLVNNKFVTDSPYIQYLYTGIVR